MFILLTISTTKEPVEDVHTFVALLDIVFRNGKKQTCTGTIVHDRAVISAAHCFGSAYSAQEPEMTTSFVVVGTKNMFDKNYELYLAIERIMRHPEYDDGEIADLALVFTFAGMTSGRPGRIIPISTTPAVSSTDANVAVLSWGEDTNAQENDQESCSDEGILRQGNKNQKTTSKFDKITHKEEAVTRRTTGKTVKLNTNNRQKATSTIGVKRLLSASGDNTHKNPQKGLSLYRSEESSDSSELDGESDGGDNFRNPTSQAVFQKFKWASEAQSQYRKPKDAKELTRFQVKNMTTKRRGVDRKMRVGPDELFSYNSRKSAKNYDNLYVPSPNIFNNWRRSLGDRVNKLSVANFTFLSGYACKKAFDEYMESCQIKSEEIVCYTTEDKRMILNAGAPILRAGMLVAVTTGAMKVGKVRVAYGLKLACFCHWIKKLLPSSQVTSYRGNENLLCCDKCCDPNVLDMTNRNRYVEYETL